MMLISAVFAFVVQPLSLAPADSSRAPCATVAFPRLCDTRMGLFDNLKPPEMGGKLGAAFENDPRLRSKADRTATGKSAKATKSTKARRNAYNDGQEEPKEPFSGMFNKDNWKW